MESVVMQNVSLKFLTAELIECAYKTANSTQKKRYQNHISTVCYTLAQQILNGEYCISNYTHFAVTEPKLREIYAPAFRDRLVQCFIVKYAEPLVERHLIEDTFANRKNKGALKAIERSQQFMRQPNHRFYMQLDIQAFFNSIHRPTLNRLWQDYFLRSRNKFNYPHLFSLVAALSEQVILHNVLDSPIDVSGDSRLLKSIPIHKRLQFASLDTGLPIGSVTSQLFANFYLSFLDHFVKHELKVKGYCRYMDDLVLFADSTAQLVSWRKQIQAFLKQTLRLNLHPTKQLIQLNQQGMRYLGYVVFPHYRYVKHYNIVKLLHYLDFFNALLNQSSSAIHYCSTLSNQRYWRTATHQFMCAEKPFSSVFLISYLRKMEAIINSYFSLLVQANHYALRKQIFHGRLGLLRTYFLPNDYLYSSIRLKKGFFVRFI